MRATITILILVIAVFNACKNDKDLNVHIKGTIIDISKSEGVANLYVCLVRSSGGGSILTSGSYTNVVSSKTDDNGNFELFYKLDNQNESVGLSINYSPDPNNHVPTLTQYEHCYPCPEYSFLLGGTEITPKIYISRYTHLTVNATTNTPLTGDDYISAEIHGTGTCCHQTFPVVSTKIRAEKGSMITWVVKRGGIINNYSQTIICKADTMNYFTIQY